MYDGKYVVLASPAIIYTKDLFDPMVVAFERNHRLFRFFFLFK